MIRAILGVLPSSWLSFCGQLQFKLPWLRALIAWCVRRAGTGEGIIQRGVGKGLRFNATGGYLGYLLGTSEPEEQAILASVLRNGSTFYDVGANIGFYSTLAARLVGEKGRVFAFEPFHASAEACRENARLNGFRNVSVIEAAVGALSGKAKLAVGNSSAVHRVEEVAAGPEIQVHSIDDWRSETSAPAPDVVMIDVEGAEIEVLQGMMALIRVSRPVILVEVHWLGTRFSDFFEEQLAPLGYRCTTYEGLPVPDGVARFHALLTVNPNTGS